MAARFWVGQSGGGNYSSTDWATTSGGTTGQLAPTSSDDVHFDGAGTFGNTACTITANAAALTLVFTTGYTSTITINATFTLTVSGTFTDQTQHTWTVNSVNAGALTLNATCTITSNSKTFPGNVTFTGNTTTKTLSGNWTISGTLAIINFAQIVNHTTAETLTIAGLTVNIGISGTIDLILSGGTWQGTSACTCTSLSFAGTITISSNVRYEGGTITYTSGTITTTSSTWTCQAATTINTNGITWNIISFTGTVTYTINSLLSTATISSGQSSTFAGTSGWTCGTLNLTSNTATTLTLAQANTYTITTAFNATSAGGAAKPTIVSSDGTLKTTLILNSGATCTVGNVNFTRIDASAGRSINTWNGTVTNCLNINSFTDALPPARIYSVHAGATY